MYKLRELSHEDIGEINSWRNDKELIDFLGAPYRYINLQTETAWYENYMKNRDTNVRCSIIDINSNTLVGLVSLTGINSINRSCELHIMIGKREYRHKGAGYFAVTQILRHAFMNLNLERVELGVLKNNLPAQKLYEKAGFKQEGIKRKAIYKNGEYVDLCIMSILKEEFDQ